MINLHNIKRVFSYHINVGHGNTSFIVIQEQNNELTIIAVDCSVTDEGKRCKSNIDSCIEEIKKKFELDTFKLNMFLLTHPHNDHYTGIMYLIDNGYIDQDTKIWLNNAYLMPSSFFITIKKTLFNMGCKFIHPISHTSKVHSNIFDIWYPSNIVIKKGTMHKIKTFTTIHLEEEKNPNNASVVVSFNFKIDDQTYKILFTGDIEKDGWNKVKCPQNLGDVNYYCISHHGSLNGHERTFCHLSKSISTVYTCPNNISKAILMGRNQAYSGIYSNDVLKDFNSKIVKTEGSKFIELEFITGNVKYY